MSCNPYPPQPGCDTTTTFITVAVSTTTTPDIAQGGTDATAGAAGIASVALMAGLLITLVSRRFPA